MKQTVTRTVTYKGCTLHARAVPGASKAGFNAEVVVSRLVGGDLVDHAVELKAWLHASADKALQYGLHGGREWIESRLLAAQASH